MPGEPVALVSGPGGHVRSFVAALARFPAEPQWAVVGEFAVHVRITDVHRVTNDLDTVSRNQPSLVEILVAEPDADRLAAASLQLNQDGAAVVVDVMDYTSDTPLPTEPGERAFALARRMALATSEETELVVVEDEAVVARTSAPVATASSLIAVEQRRANSSRGPDTDPPSDLPASTQPSCSDARRPRPKPGPRAGVAHPGGVGIIVPPAKDIVESMRFD